ncbi:hypothetical protein VNO80_03391 [Phaseolus coccineus]|uniref:Uncharacterized protein n=1 Tax=Phaseolus coccineus TaxID=3886 RepID=A0AAN9NRL0_PHACN
MGRLVKQIRLVLAFLDHLCVVDYAGLLRKNQESYPCCCGYLKLCSSVWLVPRLFVLQTLILCWEVEEAMAGCSMMVVFKGGLALKYEESMKVGNGWVVLCLGKLHSMKKWCSSVGFGVVALAIGKENQYLLWAHHAAIVRMVMMQDKLCSCYS